MAADDPNEKSLFCRIKDCVLTELNRSKNEVTRTKCPSRSMWVWNLERNTEPAEKTESPKVEKVEPPKREITRSLKDKDGASTNEKPESRLRGGHEHVERKSDPSPKNETSPSERHEHKANHENPDRDHEKHETNSEAKEHEEFSRDAEKKHEKHEQRKKNGDPPNSCESTKFKPVRYFIKMQDPEAPPCCTIRRSRKICPPKTKKYQQETRAYCPSRPTCRCGGCVAEVYENHCNKN